MSEDANLLWGTIHVESWKDSDHIVLKTTEEQCGLRELETRRFKVPLHKASQNTSVIQYFPSPFDEGANGSDGRKDGLLYSICTACNVARSRHQLYHYVASDVGIMNLH